MTPGPAVHNRHHGTAPRDAIYVGRGTVWGNPYIVGIDGTREEVLTKFMAGALSDQHLLERARRELRGRHLVCSCKPNSCHADLWLSVANNLPLPTWDVLPRQGTLGI